MKIKEEKVQIKSHHRQSALLRRKLLEKFNYSCAMCGVQNDFVPLELAHLVPLSRGGDITEDNLTILCPNCHRSLDFQPREIEFVSFLGDLLRRNNTYGDVKQEVILGRETRLRADIVVERHQKNKRETLLIECKSPSAFTSTAKGIIIEQLLAYQKVCVGCHYILAVPATLSDKDKSAFNALNIAVWDIAFIAEQFKDEIQTAPISYYKALFLARHARSSAKTREHQLINNLQECEPGKKDWLVYQKLVGEILECLFTPPLGKPISELSDKSQTNRRDFIMPNYADKGFWHFMREKYGADYIVIDAKNYTRKVRKPEILQLANYLKPHGAGQFGIIMSRNGGDNSGCEHTIREQWQVHRKLILVLHDEDAKEMLVARLDGREPEDILKQKIEQFRLSM